LGKSFQKSVFLKENASWFAKVDPQVKFGSAKRRKVVLVQNQVRLILEQLAVCPQGSRQEALQAYLQEALQAITVDALILKVCA
jgi:hypothetical protein